jgi:hypothetical protein
MPWDEQVSHSKVAELRTVSGSRHEFVDRENRIILEYRLKDNVNNNYYIEYIGTYSGLITFRIINALGVAYSNKVISIIDSYGGTFLQNYFTDHNGFIYINTSSSNEYMFTLQINETYDKYSYFNKNVNYNFGDPVDLPNEFNGASIVTYNIIGGNLVFSNPKIADGKFSTQYISGVSNLEILTDKGAIYFRHYGF